MAKLRALSSCGLVDELARQQDLLEVATLCTGRGVLAAQRRVVLDLSLLVRQAEHRPGQLVEQVLRLLGELAGRELADVRVHRPIVLADLGRVVLELLEPQQLVVVERPSSVGDLEPVAIYVERLGHRSLRFR